MTNKSPAPPKVTDGRRRFGALSLALLGCALVWFVVFFFLRVDRATSAAEFATAVWWLTYGAIALLALGVVSAGLGLSPWGSDRRVAVVGAFLNGLCLFYFLRLAQRGLW
jgi:hypothetical protein